ncbi:PIN domain-containing protein [Brevibacterium sp. K11IcPPYGO002]|uniref:PIN-like domain-containing protein n=1 Tax=Brevibacterium sp. K11IcPPYGO002 TaxID=3058837 RepID=UPI003D81306A
MREAFRAFYTPSDEEFEQIWSKGVLVLDTNTLLNFFRYTSKTRDEFLSVLRQFKDALWIPYQVGLEFQRRRLGVIHETSIAFDKINQSIEKAKNEVTKTLNGYKHHPSINRAELLNDLDELFTSFSEKLSTKKLEHEENITHGTVVEQTFQQITELFSGRVGPGFDDEFIKQIHAEGKERYAKEIPPGFQDAGKSEENRYGDLLIWKEMLLAGSERKRPMIFVTDDAKNDWWWIEHGKTLGPRVELVDEYWNAAEQRIHFYEPLKFLQFAKERAQLPISAASLEEVGEVSSSSGRIKRVLEDRLEKLNIERDRTVSRLERRQSNYGDPDIRHDLIQSLEMLDRELSNAQERSEIINRQITSYEENRDGYSNAFERDAAIYQAKELFAERSALEEHQNRLKQQREQRRLELQDTFGGNDRIVSAYKRQLDELTSEIDEVRLALEEIYE